MSPHTLRTPAPDTSEAVIARLRDRIDHVDTELLRLLEDRRSLSRAVQEARMASGGRRTELGRENAVLARYADRLGRPGGRMAMAVLEFCRGPLVRHDGAPR